MIEIVYTHNKRWFSRKSINVIYYISTLIEKKCLIILMKAVKKKSWTKFTIHS